MLRKHGLILAAAVLLAACGGGDAEPEAEDGHEEGLPQRTIEAPSAAITIDGDPSDWAAIEGLDVTLEAIRGEDVEPRAATIRVAHDKKSVYVLFEVTDDYNWNPDDAHLSGSGAVMWSIEEGAGEHMGAEEPDRETSLGMVDIWHWELECAAGEQSGGAVSEPGEGEGPGDDGACNLDDEWATIPEEREDDNGAGAENSLLGVWSHTSPTEDSSGDWIFELRRPLETEDEQDAQLAVGETALLALAYWDPDNGDAGWDDDEHAQSANQGWIEVALT
ncbi:MAG TPA: ethylbenzene dehydrogenase-related protein [Actinomycetota bacterium]|nr:ethylbenzene dehydrogenase-related protein [Actinomycetota bacterium]